jgi:fimbrial chaperone protein
MASHTHAANKRTFSSFMLIAALAGVAGSFAIFAPVALAGNFSVNPVRVFMAPRDRATAITISNEGNEPLVMNAELYKWSQDDKGEQVIVTTEEIMMTPPVIKIPPKSKQVVRIALLRPRPADEQLTYRIIVTEFLEARPVTLENVQLPMATAFSIPIFVTPRGVSKKVSCQMIKAADNAPQVQCENTGNAYSHVSKFELTSTSGEALASQDMGGYLLAGIKRSFAIQPKTGATLPAGAAKLAVRMEDASTQTFDVTIPQ